MSPKTLGQLNYEAYCEHRGWKSFHGEARPPWIEVRPDIQAAWEPAARSLLGEAEDA